jgi:predicted amidohydrolase YtcJ
MTGQQVTVLRNGNVFVADAAGSTATAVAFRGNRIVAVGGDAEVAEQVSEATDVVDLQGRMVVPGFTDAHAHPVLGGIERLRCDLTGHDSVADYQRVVSEYAAKNPRAEWILGGGWSMSAFPGGLPTREMLDDIVPDRPVALPNRDHHSAWVNTVALDRAGIDSGTPDPADGRIERDADGIPTGLLHEGAMGLVDGLIPANTQGDLDAGLRAALDYLHSVGIVGWQDAMVPADTNGPTVHQSYLRAQSEGWLTARVSSALWWERGGGVEDIDTQVAALVKIRDGVPRNDRYGIHSVKVMQDGVAETFTASMLHPYLDRCGHATDNRGISFLSEEVLREVTRALDEAGFQVHFHALGDKAVRDVLDAIEFAQATNGTSDRRHHLAHLQIVNPADIARFRHLGATANIQALWATHEPQMDELTIPFLGPERAEQQYPFGDLFRSGATLAMGSDWPVSSPDPLLAIHTAVNRASPDAPSGSAPLGKGQQLALTTALRAYTAGSAYVNRRDDLVGTIRAGAAADVVVLDRDPFDGPADVIGETRVDRTYVDGTEVFHA